MAIGCAAEYAPGDAVAWHDYFDDSVRDLGIVITVSYGTTDRPSMLIMWMRPRRLESFDADSAELMVGTIVRCVVQLA